MVRVTIQDNDSVMVNVGGEVVQTVPNEYTGATEITPSAETQTLQTANTSVLQNIIINPIPSNYGLITWDGSKLTVS